MQLGFVGIGGSAFITGFLILLFHIPVHLAFGTGLGAMFANSTVGGWSHLREGNVVPVVGLQIGLSGMLGAYLGGGLALSIGPVELKTISGLVLLTNAFVLYLRTKAAARRPLPQKPRSFMQMWWDELPTSCLIGISCGWLSGFLSIGAIPWIQVGLLVLKRTDLPKTVGTGLFSLAFISFGGAFRFAQGGQVDLWLVVAVVLGLSVGSFIGAKFTRLAPRWLLRWAMIATPLSAGTMLLLAPARG